MRAYFRCLGLSVVVLLALTGVEAGAETSAATPAMERLAGLEFRDQHGQVDSLARRRGAPVVAVVVAVRRLAMIEQWERDLTARVPGIRFINVADLPEGASLDRTANMLRKRVPPDVNVLLDPTREWAVAYALDTAAPNLLVFDATGQLVARFRGRWTSELAAQVAGAVPRGAPGS